MPQPYLSGPLSCWTLAVFSLTFPEPQFPTSEEIVRVKGHERPKDPGVASPIPLVLSEHLQSVGAEEWENVRYDPFALRDLERVQTDMSGIVHLAQRGLGV